MSNDLVLNLRIRTNAENTPQVLSQTERGITNLASSTSAASQRMTAGMSSSATASQLAARTIQASTGSMAAGMSSAATSTQIAAASVANSLRVASTSGRASMQSMTESMVVSLNTINATMTAMDARIAASGGASATALRGTASASSGATLALGGLRGVIATLGISVLAKDMLDTVEQVQNLETRLRSLTTSASDYADTELYLSGLAQNHHKNNLDLQSSFAQLLTIEQTGIITRGQSKQILEGMSNAQSRTGATSDALRQSMVGLIQALSMGTLAWEEVKQVTEPIPGLMKKIAESAGFTGKSAIGDFKQLVSSGEYTSDMFGRILPDALAKYDGAAAASGANITAQFTDIKNSWAELAKVLEGPVSDTLTPIIEGARASLDGIVDAIKYLKSLNAIQQQGMRAPGYVKPVQSSAFSDLLSQPFAPPQKTTAFTAAQKDAILIGEEYLRYLNKEDEAVKKHGKTVDSVAKAKESAARKVADAINNEIAALNNQHQKLTLSERAYQQAKLAGMGMEGAVLNSAMAVWDSNKALEKQTDVNDKAKSAMESLIDKYNQLTLSARDYYLTTLKDKDGKALSPELTAPLAQQFDKNAVLEANKQLIDDATASVNKYASSIDSAKNNMADLGGVTSSVFDGALGGVSLLSGAIDNMVTALEKNASALDQLGMDRLDNDEKQRAGLKALADMRVKGQISESEAIIARGKINAKWSENERGLTKSEIALSKEKTGTELSGARQIAGAAARMFDEKSSAAKALHALEMGIAVAQMAMQVKSMAVSALATGKSIIAGAAKFFEQSGWLGFAGVAAMGAVMAGLGYAAFSGGGNAAPPVYSTDTGTVLGDPTARSESIDKTYNLLKDIHAEEYAELRGINAGIASLKGGITNVITRLFQAGGIKEFAVMPGNTNAGFGMIGNTIQMGAMLGSGGLAKFDPIANKVLGFLFGGKQTSTVTAQGIMTDATAIADIMAGGNLSARQFATIQTTRKGGLFSSSKTWYSEQYAALDAATQDSLNKVFGSMGHTMLGLAESIGHDTKQKVESYIIPAMRVDLKGLSGEDAAKRLNGVISAALDTMATTVFGGIIGQYQQLGEGMLETAVRIVAEVAVVEDALSKSGLSIAGDAIAISDGLAQAAGGLQEFQKQFDNYYQKFYTEAERNVFTQKQLNSQLSDVNLLLPETRDGYRKVIEALDINNAADQQRYSMLLKLSDAADSYYQTIESQAEDAQRIAQQRRALDIEYMTLSSRALGALIERRKDELAALDPSLRFRQQAVWAASEANKAIDDAMATLKKSVADQKALNAAAHKDKMDALAVQRQAGLDAFAIQKQAAADLLGSLKTVAANIKTALGSTVIESRAYMRQRRLDAQNVLSAALSSAQAGGSLANFKNLEQALADIAKPSEQLYASFVDYALDQARTGAVISGLEAHATAQISVTDQTLAAIEANTKQLSASIEASTKQLSADLEAGNAALDALITTAQAQIDAARGTTVEVMSVKDAVNNLARALQVRAQTLRAIDTASAATAFADAAKKIADAANSKAQSSADALAAQIALSDRAAQAAADAQRNATALATWQPAPDTWRNGQTDNPLWERVLGEFNAWHASRYGVEMNRPWSADGDARAAYGRLVAQYNAMSASAASAAQASASALAATADAIKTAIPDLQAAADTDARAASTANADAAAKAAAARAAQSAAVEFEYIAPGGAAINKIADKFYNAFNGLTVSASTKKDNFEALRRASGFGAVYELATKQGLDSRGLDLLMDWSAGTSAQKAANWKLPAFAVGINDVPFDMTAIIHQGERILPAADNRELMMRLSEPRQDNGNAAIVAEIKALRAEVAGLHGEIKKIEKNTGGTESSSKRMADQLRSMTPDGQSLRMTPA